MVTLVWSIAKIKDSVQAGVPLTAVRSAYTRSIILERMEKMLAIWIQAQNKKSVTLLLFKIT